MVRRLFAALSVMIGLICVPAIQGQNPTAEQTAEPDAVATESPTVESGFVIYRVQLGDTLSEIATRYGLTASALAAANGLSLTSVIVEGQQLRIPQNQGARPQPIPERYTIQQGDTLAGIALIYGTTVQDLVALNPFLTNPDMVRAGVVIQLPQRALPAPQTAEATEMRTPAATTQAPSPQTTPVPETPTVTAQETEAATQEAEPAETQDFEVTAEVVPLPTVTFERGVEVFFAGQPVGDLLEQLAPLNVTWVKLTLDWRDIEPERGTLLLQEADVAIRQLNGAGYRLLLTLTGAPGWARPQADPEINAVQTGPPENLDAFADFAAAVALRYRGRVAAYEIWTQPNIRTWWRAQTDPPRMSDVSYPDMLRLAYEAIKRVDPSVTVISAGLAPTGFNDRVNAIDDRVFVRGLYENDVQTYSDAIGVHPDGFANPPDFSAPQQFEGVETHYEEPVFFFQDTLRDYRQIMVEFGDAATPLWITRFGWGTSEGNDLVQPDQTAIFYTYNSPSEVGDYAISGYNIADKVGYVAGAILYNLNGCGANLGQACYYSLLEGDGAMRPVYERLSERAGS